MTPVTGTSLQTPTPDSWRDLFAPCEPGQAQATAELSIVRRAGQPFLLLPASPRLAAKSLALYPAQTGKARAAKLLLGLALRTGIRLRLEKVSLPVGAGDSFAAFLAQTASLVGEVLPPFAILAGNPHAVGRRFVVLVFDAGGGPAGVVKAGGSDAARRLIAREESFLQTAPPGTAGIPKLRASFHSPRVQAFTTDFFAGHSPGLKEMTPLAQLLTSWVAVSRRVTLSELGAWQRLAETSAGTPPPKPVRDLAGATFHPALAHGDFAPWNVKVWRGQWTLLDWERGELAGVPGWDWFHFVIQPAVLVRRETVAQLIDRVEQLLASEGFVRYARHAGISGAERALALAYLSFCTRVVKQTEGLEKVESLERAARQRWFPSSG
jgi:hypothetical protein